AGAFADKSNAHRLAQQLSHLGFDAFVKEDTK
ncbi:SPOR domain-containing protein, partial [Ligaoa zhengdingensis]